MSELRYNPLTERWVILAPGRVKRPKIHNGNTGICPFCPGNENMTPPEIFRVTADSQNAVFKYSNKDSNWLIRVVPNKYPALAVEGDLDREGVGIYDKMNGIGAHEVIIERQTHKEIWEDTPERNFWLWKSIILRMRDLEKDKRFKYLSVFKNYKKEGGASLDHPHFQLVALPFTPEKISSELKICRNFYDEKERCLVCDIIRQEEKEQARIICENDHFIAYCPYASMPFEVCIAPKKNKHSHSFMSIGDNLICEFANIVSKTLGALSVALEDSAFNLSIHTAPFFRTKRKGHGATITMDYHWHCKIYPRIGVYAGLELGAGVYINSASPEKVAELLRIKAIIFDNDKD